MKKKSTGQAAAKAKREIELLSKMRDSEVDFLDIPWQDPNDPKWKNAVIGRFYRPIKQPVALRLDADVLAWLKSKGSGYQSRINRMLRQQMISELKR
jgi:uncharacterized protein (DUF4415 family)